VPTPATTPVRPAPPTGSPAALSIAALGIVFGDIGTSPLYTLKTVLAIAGDKPGAATTLGSLSLIIWTLIVITWAKYVNVAMRIDNDGEGGIMALMSLLGVKRGQRPLIIGIGLFGAALIYGDGAITPAISVLSALEGLQIAAPHFQPYVLPLTVLVLVLLFAVQPLGTAKIGRAFGPVMALWFVSIAVLGVWGILQHPSVLAALNPALGIAYLFSGGAAGFLILGGVFLCVTGAEALYADMGHFGARPIRLSWSALVFPSLALNYAGQAALVLNGAPTSDNIFFRLCPGGLLVPLVMLATIATIIASQSIITGAFSMTRQAIQLGWLPRLRVLQTSAEGYGQIYVGPVNWLLMIVTVGLALGFRKSDNLASAYGIAVSVTMLMTSGLLYIAMREIWQWSLPAAAALASVFVVIDAGFVAANMMKVADGGYVPLLLAAALYAVMQIWHRGSAAVNARLYEEVVPVSTFLDKIRRAKIPRVPGTAVFLTRTLREVPPVMSWQAKRIGSLHERLFVLTVRIEPVPWIRDADRLRQEEIAEGFWRAVARFGFMERPDIPALLRKAQASGCTIEPAEATYFVGHERVVRREDGVGLPGWVVEIFSFMQRNSLHVSDYLRLPAYLVVEIGPEVAI
jgi:KUP system potassium uptake protein